MQINAKNENKIILKIIYEQIPTKFICDQIEILENILIAFANDNKLNYNSIYFLYSGSSLLPYQLKKPIYEIIKTGDLKEKRMLLLAYQLEFDTIQEDEIIIILSIESTKIELLTGKKGDKIIDIIRDSIKLDLNYCIFKYKNKKIDLEKKFDDIADNEDKKQLKIELIANYTIPLIVNFVNEKKIYTIQCLLGDRVDNKIEQYFIENHLDSEDYYLVYENKIFEDYYYKIFYEIIPEDKIQNSFQNENINNNTIKSFPSSETLNESNQIKFFDKEKIMVLPEINKRKIEIEINVILKSCSIRYKRKISKCCRIIKIGLLYFIGSVFIFIGLFLFFGGWILFL